MPKTNGEVRKLMEAFVKCGRVEAAALRAGMDRKTARKYLRDDVPPSERRRDRDWRTRTDPFAADWATVEELLTTEPGLEALTVFDELRRRHPDRYQDGQLRTLQRQIRRWRALRGPEREVFFAQEHRPGEALQTDFTDAAELAVTVAGEAFPHLLCHTVLPYSNWESATSCASESMPALKRGVQTALVRLGRAPQWHQTDHSTAATHRLGREGAAAATIAPGSAETRGFNEEYLRFCAHYGLRPRTTGVGKKEQNGDSEASHRALKRRLQQRLLLRGARDFATVAEYERFVGAATAHANRGRSTRLAAELATMRPLPDGRFPDCREYLVRVSWGSTVRVQNNVYSVPSRLIGATLDARVYDDRIEVRYAGALQLTTARLRGEGGHRVDYRHLAPWLVRKPGAFARYRYREDLFPTLTFRRAFDRLTERLSSRQADRHYLGVLHLAARTMECDVDRALAALLEEGGTPTLEAVEARSAPPARPAAPELAPLTPDLSVYDGLFAPAAEAG